MATLYFAKFNINERIYEVYEDEAIYELLLGRVFTNLNEQLELTEYNDNKTVRYKFITLDKKPDQFIINGRLVAYAPGTHVSYDEETDNIVETEDNKKATYVTFSFDLRREIIGFVTKNDFGRKQFIDRFTGLVENMCPDLGEIEIYLETDKRILDEKMEKFKHVTHINLELIPPNNDKKLFRRLFDLDPEKINDVGGTSFIMRIKGSAKKGINTASQYVKNLVLGVSLGYGVMTAEGIDTSSNPYNVKSDKDALYVKNIHNNNKDNIIAIEELTRSGVSQILISKIDMKSNYLEEIQNKKEELLKSLDGEMNNGEQERRD